MYAEQFNILNPSDLVESAAKWVQWAFTGSLAGGSKTDEVKYNLNQFWTTKNAVYNTATTTDRGNLERLDVFAHGIWDAIEEGKIISSGPAFMDYLKAFYFGGVPVRSGSIDAAAQAKAALTGQAAAAARAGTFPGQAGYASAFTDYASRGLKNLPGQTAAADSFWKQAGVDVLGVPLWAWGAATAGLLLLFVSGRR